MKLLLSIKARIIVYSLLQFTKTHARNKHKQKNTPKLLLNIWLWLFLNMYYQIDRSTEYESGRLFCLSVCLFACFLSLGCMLLRQVCTVSLLLVCSFLCPFSFFSYMRSPTFLAVVQTRYKYYTCLNRAKKIRRNQQNDIHKYIHIIELHIFKSIQRISFAIDGEKSIHNQSKCMHCIRVAKGTHQSLISPFSFDFFLSLSSMHTYTYCCAL